MRYWIIVLIQGEKIIIDFASSYGRARYLADKINPETLTGVGISTTRNQYSVLIMNCLATNLPIPCFRVREGKYLQHIKDQEELIGVI